jgi:Tol biopolymer transport system component
MMVLRHRHFTFLMLSVCLSVAITYLYLVNVNVAEENRIIESVTQNALIERWDGYIDAQTKTAEYYGQLAKVRPAQIRGGIEWSPDGSKLVFVGGDFRESYLWVVNRDGTNLRNLQPDGEETINSFPIWRGNHIFYLSASRNSPILELWQMDEDGQNPTNLTSDIQGNLGWYDVSPDGQSVVFSKSASEREAQVWLMHLPDRMLIKIPNQTLQLFEIFTWSPDGQSILLTSYDPDTVSEPRLLSQKLWLYHLAENRIEFLANRSYFAIPAWSPDGKHVAFMGTTPCPERPYGLDILLFNVETFAETNLTRGTCPSLGFITNRVVWSPDGLRLAYQQASGEEFTFDTQIQVIDLAGNITTIAPRAEEGYNAFSWSPAGDALAITGSYALRGSIWIVSPDGKNAVEISKDWDNLREATPTP